MKKLLMMLILATGFAACDSQTKEAQEASDSTNKTDANTPVGNPIDSNNRINSGSGATVADSSGRDTSYHHR